MGLSASRTHNKTRMDKGENMALRGFGVKGCLVGMGKNHKKVYTADFFLLLVSFGFPFGWEMSGLPHSIELACICWAITLLVLLHIIWTWTEKWKMHFRVVVISVLPALLPVIAITNTIIDPQNVGGMQTALGVVYSIKQRE